MSNPQTAADWKKVADEQLAIAKEVGEKEKVIGRQLASVYEEQEKIEKQIRTDASALRILSAALARGEKLEPEGQKRYDLAISRNDSNKARAAELEAQRTSLQSQAAPFTSQRVNAERAAQEAFQKSKEASEAKPDANSVPAPAGDSANANSTGSPTAVQPDPPTVDAAKAQQTVSDPGTGEQVAAPILPPTGTVREISPTGEFGPEQPLAGPAQAQQTVSDSVPGGGTQAEADAIIQAQKEADRTEYETQTSATQAEADAINAAQQAQQTSEAQSELTRESRRGLSGKVNDTRAQATVQDAINFNQLPDWRVRLKLAPNATKLLYKAADPGILQPLQATDGIIFPYTPSIQLGYTAAYDAFDVTHSNYKIFQYKNSAVEQLTIAADFTAQDANEAAYVLAVIHFFRSVTKMFYGKDENPIAGTPPPLCYIYGLGDFQFNQHPLVISNFSYALPTDVDYIRAGAPTLFPGQSSASFNTPNNSPSSSGSRMQASNVPVGGKPAPPNWTTKTNIEPTYIPTKIQLSITAYPIVTRKDISDNFSVQDYASGKLLRGKQNSKGGIW